MEITIKDKSIGEAELNLIRFKKDLQKHFNIEKAFYDNVILTKCSNKDEEYMLKLIYQWTDWGNILMLFNVTKPKVMVLKVLECFIKDFTYYNPHSINKEKMKLILEPKRKDMKEFIVINSFNCRIDKHLDYLLGNNMIDYGTIKWKREIDLE